MTNAVFIPIRNSSIRLPNKSLKIVKNNLRSIDIVIERAKKTNFFVILTTSTDPSDDVFVDIAKEHSIAIFRGSLKNKIKRWHDCFKTFEIQNALIVDGDDLCFDYDIGIRSIDQLTSSSLELITYTKNIVPGFFTYAMTFNAVEKLYTIANSDSIDTDVIDKFIEKANLKSDFVILKPHEQNKNIRLTLDYVEDLEFFRKLYEHLDILDDGETIVKFLEKNENIVKINLFRHADFLENKIKFNEKIQ
ncbi:MAG: cytidylyltransferase domain-containing protein [Candidatus Nitrosopumilus sp. bin_7KS]